MKTIPMNRDCFEPKYDLKEVFGTDVVKWTSVRDNLAPHVYFHSSKTGVFSVDVDRFTDIFNISLIIQRLCVQILHDRY